LNLKFGTMITKVEMYKTQDGRVFDTKEWAKEIVKRQEMAGLINDFIDLYYSRVNKSTDLYECIKHLYKSIEMIHNDKF